MNSALTLDIPLSRKVLEHLIAHPEEHRQENFGMRTACGTTACIAGTAILMDPDTQATWDQYGGMQTQVRVGEKIVDVDHRAAELLGLHPHDANALFFLLGNAQSLEYLGQLIDDAEAKQAAA